MEDTSEANESNEANNILADPMLKKLLWASRRGMLELDIILEPYLLQEFGLMDEEQKQHFADFLKQDDPDLYAWLMGFAEASPEYLDIVNKIKTYITQQIA